jgi:ribosome assembly protein YihI (activator of Der GTPase)
VRPSEENSNRSSVGVAALDALDDSPLLQQDDQLLISAVLDAIVEPVVEQYGFDDDVEED